MPQVGEEWIYRLRDSSPSERVLIRGLGKNRPEIHAKESAAC